MILKQKNFVSAVVYVCNDERRVGFFLKTLHEIMSENFEKFEIIFVNDASKDSTNEIIKTHTEDVSNCIVSILNMSYYSGVEISMCAGIDLAIGDFVFEFDSVEIDYEIRLIMDIYERSLQGFDIVSTGKGTTRLSSKIFYALFNRVSGNKNILRTDSFRLISRRGINRVNSMNLSLPYRKAVYSSSGLKMDYIKYIPNNKYMRNKQVIKNPHDTAVNVLILFSDVAYKLIMFFTIFMMIATLGIAGYVVAIGIMGLPVAGWATTMLLISGLFFTLFVILAIIIKYLSLILSLVFSRQKYTIESIEKISD